MTSPYSVDALNEKWEKVNYGVEIIPTNLCLCMKYYWFLNITYNIPLDTVVIITWSPTCHFTKIAIKWHTFKRGKLMKPDIFVRFGIYLLYLLKILLHLSTSKFWSGIHIPMHFFFREIRSHITMSTILCNSMTYIKYYLVME